MNTLAAIKIRTDHPIASDSNDHLFPLGAINDNTSCPAFLKACERIMPAELLLYLDLGCAGGQLVREFIEAGNVAFGVDGAAAAMRENWAKYPDHYFGADISHAFTIESPIGPPGMPICFDVISAWEVPEHIPEERLPQFFQNVRTHLKETGLFVSTISTVACEVNGHVYHRTIHDLNWWRRSFLNNGLIPILSPFSDHEYARHDTGSYPLVARKA